MSNVRKELQAELLTQAWAKFYEMASKVSYSFLNTFNLWLLHYKWWSQRLLTNNDYNFDLGSIWFWTIIRIQWLLSILFLKYQPAGSPGCAKVCFSSHLWGPWRLYCCPQPLFSLQSLSSGLGMVWNDTKSLFWRWVLMCSLKNTNTNFLLPYGIKAAVLEDRLFSCSHLL